MASKLSSVIIPSVQKHTATVIFLHGLGDSGQGWSFLAQEWSHLKHIKWIFPNAPLAPVTVNGGMCMPSWYDIYSFTALDKEDEEGMMRSRNYVQGLIEAEMKDGIPSERILLGGFSQGCMISFLAGLTFPKTLAGLACLSGFLPIPETLKRLFRDEAKKTPIFLAYQSYDPVIPSALSAAAAKTLDSSFGCNVSSKCYDGFEHGLTPLSFKDLGTFVETVIGKP
ncbi:phospholipase [Schizosaccharomyces japonicus yFS275]|uniref:Acyl-protein thioesterase 1 n=1 Tax=Schizosaccharomyces japonicus (strain yFS275 / FY16936) TaxID=402676 RepID=B6K204_SCHJY|nr:phospholipase [Schizosaccharomyces japonicus yFS275]EEB07185.1 phospholipase [Schizosaccharomyces japonicus yFS275]